MSEYDNIKSDEIKSFEIKLLGVNAIPENFTLNELFNLFSELQDALKIEAYVMYPNEIRSNEKLELKLIELKNNCILTKFEPTNIFMNNSFEKISESIKDNKYDTLSYDTGKKLQSFNKKIKDKGIYNCQFISEGNVISEIDKTTDIILDKNYINDYTTIYVKVEYLYDGKQPSTKIRLSNDHAITIKISKSIGLKLKDYLYSSSLVGLEGKAKYSIKNFKLLDFTIEKIVENESLPLTKALKDIRDIVGDHFDGKDINDLLLND